MKVNNNIIAYALDNSSERIKQAGSLKDNKGLGINFETGDLKKMPYRSNFFDLVICRFVYEHNPSYLNILTQEVYRVLKPGGRYILIDVDGLLYNLETDNKVVKLCLSLLKDKLNFFDGYVCKKIPKNLTRCGFTIDRVKKASPVFFDDKERAHEHAMWILRFDQAKAHFVSVLGEDLFDLFRESYLNEILNKENFLYSNKFSFFPGSYSL
jgi:SAM-dependent methyltransferase